jgi:hypothetical protein
MRVHLGVPLLAFAIGACATVEPEPPAHVIGIPPAWAGTIGASASYEIGLDRVDRHGGHAAAYLTGPLLFTQEVAFFGQSVRADNYRGKRVRLSAWVKGRELTGPIAGIWMRVDGAGVVTGYDDMGGRAETGTTDWHQIFVVLDVPANALGIVIGAMRQGGGTLLVDDMTLETVGLDVPTTNMFVTPLPNAIDPAETAARYQSAPGSPSNMRFETVP